jgi:hypothetical protein
VKNPFKGYTLPICTSISPDPTLNVSDPGINPNTYLAGQHTIQYPIGNSSFFETQTSDYDAANEKIKEVIPTCVQTRLYALFSAPEGSSTYQCLSMETGPAWKVVLLRKGTLPLTASTPMHMR